ncbi:uncharacterized protein B0T15DRAFT_540616 [Chaetomium strumarium]|uniref:Chromo domain-containing protein n=1 Tax=Chaetomium strumarium TaxID=1170767 RepID=A0AAJ0GP81_9PEZI|nr:hypothetical protein B0T15DRAFT_540616 [Chaetomium strumarium]
MPPAFSDEEPSDVEIEQSSTKKLGRGKKPVSYQDNLDEEDVKNGTNGSNDLEADDDNEDGDEEEVYVVEKIMSHMIDPKQGKPYFEVKWEGYDDEADRTWEPEENLVENASEALNEYLQSIGGREKLLEETAKVLKSKKRGRPSPSTPQPTQKRSRRNGGHPVDSEPPLSAKAATWKPPPGSWEDHIAQLDACEDEVTHKLVVYVTWKNGHKTQHETSVIYQRCPQKMLQFYERHVRIIKRDPELDSA